MSPPKNCAVCGDKALGYNFNAVTCESCKAFFRRNALAKKQFTCPFNQNCDITVVTRRFCQKCRLKKCLDIGMKSENIMSEEDKLIKRRKIENNRAKRRMMENADDPDDSKAQADSSSNLELYSGSQDSQSCGSVESGANGCVAGPASSSAHARSPSEINPLLMTADKIVDQIVSDPDRASQAINRLMRTQKEAISVMEKVIGSQNDALRLVSHLIDYPGDALKIISKFMNSPFNALTVFTKFMSSPTDGVEIISKIVDSPADVVEFMQNLMHSPEDAIDIMNKFMNTPAEALRIVNRILSGGTNSSQPTDRKPLLDKASGGGQEPERNAKPESERVDTVIQSMLESGSPSPINTSTSSPHDVAVDLQYHSPCPNQMGDEQPSTSSSHPLPYIANSPDFDLKTFMQTNYNDEPSLDSDFSINSIESVLSEVIRIEYQAFNSIQAASRIKEEMSYMGGQSAYNGCNANTNNNQQQHMPQQPICAPSTMHMDRELNEAEQMKLRELRLASEALYDPVDEDLSALMMGDDRIKPDDTRHNPKLLQLINLTAVAIKRLIKMAKKITAFRDMCQEDQVALLKGGCTEMMIMRSVMIYDDDRDSWKVPHTKENMGTIRTDLLKFAEGNIYEEHQKFITTFDEKWRMDENIILIMCAIVLFTSARSRVIHKDVIRLEQNSYYYLLRRYLESVYSGCEAKNAFIKLIQKISDVERLNKFIINVYLNVNPSQVEPLLREIFDLKNH
ncbi:nuclear hormone receptor HR96 [Drosophila persimilis]|uniref:nuclear hormone receptor HR96 n=1 Tax=Drosophila persimilis TaxID=7234 RepID=UPI000F085F73|nr:nuclear hormone receptor HR96 [Drosophila persimilis]